MRQKSMSNDHLSASPLPLAALRAFAAAARLGSVTAAATALGVTQGAVSRQVIALERYLGLRLFDRRNRRIVPTAAGEELAATVAPAFRDLEQAVQRLRDRGGEVALVVSTTFSLRWLMPRLGDFLAAHDRLGVRLVTRDGAEAALDDEQAAVIGYCRDGVLPAGAVALLQDRSAPICSPGYLAAARQAPPWSSLAGQRLLVSTADGWDWRAWAEAAGLSLGDLGRAFRFDNDEAAIQGALAGAGLSLQTLALLDRELSEGRLLRPAGLPSVLFGTYYLRPPLQQPAGRLFQPMQDWLLAGIAAAADRVAQGVAEGAAEGVAEEGAALQP